MLIAINDFDKIRANTNFNFYNLESKVLLEAIKHCYTRGLNECNNCPFQSEYCNLIAIVDIARVIRDIPGIEEDLENLEDIVELIETSKLLIEGIDF